MDEHVVIESETTGGRVQEWPEMSNPIPPSVRCEAIDWNRCIDHPLVYVGIAGPIWLRRHLWVCADGSHLPEPPDQLYYPPAYYTRDGHGEFNIGAGQEREALGFWLKLRARLAEPVEPE